MTPWRIISQPKPRHVHKFSVATHFHTTGSIWMLRDSGAPYGSRCETLVCYVKKSCMKYY